MATIVAYKPTERDLHVGRAGNVKVAYLVERDIDLTKLAEKKGSALANGDIVEALKLPAQSVVIGAYVAVVEATSATSLVVNVVSGATTFATAQELAGKTNGAIAASVSPAPLAINTPTETLDLVITTVTGAAPKGVVRVAAHVLDLSKAKRPGLVQLGS